MKSFIPVFLVILTFLTGCEPEVKRQETVAAPPPSDPGYIVCVQCKGEKFIMIRTDARNAEIRQACPICIARGFRKHVIPAGKAICKDCKGMGAMLEPGRSIRTNSISTSGNTGTGGRTTKSAPQKVTCTRCIGSGLVFSAAR